MKYAEKERRSLYIIGWLLPGIAAVCLLLSKVLGVDLPDDVIDQVVQGVKAKLTMDQVSDTVGKIKDLFH